MQINKFIHTRPKTSSFRTKMDNGRFSINFFRQTPDFSPEKLILIAYLVILSSGCLTISRKPDIVSEPAIDSKAEIKVEKKLEEEFEKGIIAPDFKLQDITDTFVTLSDYKDKKPVILFFWATWCPFCREELKILNEMHSQIAKDGIEVLAIDVGESKRAVERFIKNYSLGYKVLLDKEQGVAYSYGVTGIPAYSLITKKGRIIFSGHYFPREEYKSLISE